MSDDAKLYQDCLILVWLLMHEMERKREQEVGTLIRMCGECEEVGHEDE